jgi:hypothetical protein
VSVFESSARYLLQHYPRSELLIAYIPSPITSYQLDMVMVPVKLPDGSIQEYPVSRVELVSDRVCEQIADVAFELGANFLDTRPPIRAAGQAQMIHGPTDWQHFNEVGYKVLGSTVASRLTDAFNTLSKNGTSRLETETSLAKSHCARIAKYDGDEATQLLGPRTPRTD